MDLDRHTLQALLGKLEGVLEPRALGAVAYLHGRARQGDEDAPPVRRITFGNVLVHDVRHLYDKR